MKKATGSEPFSNEKSTALVHAKSNLFQQLAAFCATTCNQHCLLVINIPGVSKSRYFGISIPIKYSNFSRFYKKMGPFYKKFRCDKFGN